MIKVGVIRGGISPKYDMSLATGGHVLSILRDNKFKDKYKVIDMLLDKEGILHINGLPVKIDDLHKHVDIVFNALHGEYGEDGKLQQLLERWKIPYTGSGIFPSALAFNKRLTKYKLESFNLKTPQYIIFQNDDPELVMDENYPTYCAQKVWRKMPAPWIVKPITPLSYMGIHVCKTFPELVQAFELATRLKVSVIVEEFIIGKEASVVTLDKFRNQNTYTLPVLEVIKDNIICPAKLSTEEKRQLEELAKFVHKEFNLEHYSKTNFILHPRAGVYILGVDTLPQVSPDSHIHQALQAVGSSTDEFIDNIVQLALGKK